MLNKSHARAGNATKLSLAVGLWSGSPPLLITLVGPLLLGLAPSIQSYDEDVVPACHDASMCLQARCRWRWGCGQDPPRC